MPLEVKLPEIGDGIESADVMEVLVREGDIIEEGQDIVELETDKATMGVPSSHAGKIIAVHVSEGDAVPIGAPLITLEVVEEASKPAEPEPQPGPPPSVSPPTQVQNPVPAATTKPGDTATASPPTSRTVEDMSDVPAGPSIRRLARELGIDLRTVQGTGRSRRITRGDVMAAVRNSGQVQREQSQGECDQWGPVQYKKLSKIRRTIAAKMHESWSTVPRVTNFDDADVTELEDFRQDSKQDYATKGIKLTSVPFVMKAVAMSLKKHPDLNASLDLEHDRIIYKNYVNLGIAVDTERGLVVPSLRGVDDLSISEIARALSDVVDNVRAGNFSPKDLQGSTFTISNLGAIGGSYSTPIINVPEVAILLLGRSRKMPVVIDDELKVRLLMPLSLSYDHRIVDGAAAGRFLNDVISYLEAPSRLLLAP